MKNRYLDIDLEAGVDESGAGSAFGPVVASCVILPKNWYFEGINDSKKLSQSKRERLYEVIIRDAISYTISEVSALEIDEINILQARFLAMDKCIKSMKIQPKHILIDGNSFYKKYHIPNTCIVRGDAEYTSIAAASILAKVYRDRLMVEMSKLYDKWEIEKHKGYLTKRHDELILENGLSQLHRKSFCKKYINNGST